jgi:hypothetical protein
VDGETAQEHLNYILQKASLANPPVLQRIAAAVAACLAGTCIRNSTGRPGLPPPDQCLHGQFVLWARCHADESNWGLCADELEHGT